ncbi:MAG: penicillin-binding protein activator LpoB [Phycisphaerae bacterium]|nr:penicillin-binding protein activator LpoB [Phycisphaerae bacterium]
MNAERLALSAAVLAALTFLAGCAADPSLTWQRELVGTSYIDQTHDCRISAPNANWTFKMASIDFGDGWTILNMFRPVYNCVILIGVSQHSQKDLETFAQVGTFIPREAKFTYIAGMPCHYSAKPMSSKSVDWLVFVYKFVHNNVGYVISCGYPSQWQGDETLAAELDEILNSFEFVTGPSPAAATGGAGRASAGEKLVRVAVLDIVDLPTGAPTQVTRSLTDEVQNQCMKSGHFELLDRREFAAILKEHDLQAGTMGSGQLVIEAGKLLGARYLLTGNLGQVGESSVIYLQVCDAQTGQIIRTASVRCRGSQDRLLDAIPSLVTRLSAPR